VYMYVYAISYRVGPTRLQNYTTGTSLLAYVSESGFLNQIVP